jgi:hypothetical protein
MAFRSAKRKRARADLKLKWLNVRLAELGGAEKQLVKAITSELGKLVSGGEWYEVEPSPAGAPARLTDRVGRRKLMANLGADRIKELRSALDELPEVAPHKKEIGKGLDELALSFSLGRDDRAAITVLGLKEQLDAHPLPGITVEVSVDMQQFQHPPDHPVLRRGVVVASARRVVDPRASWWRRYISGPFGSLFDNTRNATYVSTVSEGGDPVARAPEGMTGLARVWRGINSFIPLQALFVDSVSTTTGRIGLLTFVASVAALFGKNIGIDLGVAEAMRGGGLIGLLSSIALVSAARSHLEEVRESALRNTWAWIRRQGSSGNYPGIDQSYTQYTEELRRLSRNAEPISEREFVRVLAVAPLGGADATNGEEQPANRAPDKKPQSDPPPLRPDGSSADHQPVVAPAESNSAGGGGGRRTSPGAS